MTEPPYRLFWQENMTRTDVNDKNSTITSSVYQGFEPGTQSLVTVEVKDPRGFADGALVTSLWNANFATLFVELDTFIALGVIHDRSRRVYKNWRVAFTVFQQPQYWAQTIGPDVIVRMGRYGFIIRKDTVPGWYRYINTSIQQESFNIINP